MGEESGWKVPWDEARRSISHCRQPANKTATQTWRTETDAVADQVFAIFSSGPPSRKCAEHNALVNSVDFVHIFVTEESVRQNCPQTRPNSGIRNDRFSLCRRGL